MSTATTTATERRKHVILGDLDPSFLRLSHPQGQQFVNHGNNCAPMPYMFQPFHAMPPSNSVGRLLITVNQAKLTKNYGLTRMDPYCRVSLAHHVFETPTSPNGAKNPRWNKTFAIYLPSGVDAFTVEIFNEMTFSVDDRIAWGFVTLPIKIFEGQTVDDWYPVSGRQGDEREGIINIVLTLENLPAVSPVHSMSVAYGHQQHPHPAPARAASHRPRPVQPITDEDISSLQEMFPDTDTEVIKSVLESQRGHKESAISALLLMQTN